MPVPTSPQILPIPVISATSPIEVSTSSEVGAAPRGAVNPLNEPGWDSLLDTHPESCFFHTSSWARVLHETYGHTPIYFCDVRNRELRGLLAMMEVRRPLRGRCGVSLPFTDLCPALFGSGEPDWNPYEQAIRYGQARAWKWLECRGGNRRWPGAVPALAFYAHSIALEQSPEMLFKRLRGTVRTALKKARASELRIEFEQTEQAVKPFYRLHSLTRRRHGLPPQPQRFFDSIGRHVLNAGQGVVAFAVLGRKPVATAMFFYRGRQAFLKFSASDYDFQQLRPNNLLLWEAMRWLRERGISSLHLGRTSLAQAGLRRFKLGFGAQEEQLEYFRYALGQRAFVAGVDRAQNAFNSFFRLLPLPLLRLSGTLLYPHLPG